MTETTKTSGEKLSVSSSKTLSLKPRVEQGVVRQSFSHGRSKAVVVEKVKRRIPGPGEVKPEPVATPDRSAAAKRPSAAPKAPVAAAARTGHCTGRLPADRRTASHRSEPASRLVHRGWNCLDAP